MIIKGRLGCYAGITFTYFDFSFHTTSIIVNVVPMPCYSLKRDYESQEKASHIHMTQAKM